MSADKGSSVFLDLEDPKVTESSNEREIGRQVRVKVKDVHRGMVGGGISLGKYEHAEKEKLVSLKVTGR